LDSYRDEMMLLKKDRLRGGSSGTVDSVSSYKRESSKKYTKSFSDSPNK
jgi:hypothetical protein